MQSYQTYSIENDSNLNSDFAIPMAAPRSLATSFNNDIKSNGTILSPTTETRIRTLAYENENGDLKSLKNNAYTEDLEHGQMVSTKAITTGNRTVETLTVG